jgi:hypothetical protein
MRMRILANKKNKRVASYLCIHFRPLQINSTDYVKDAAALMLIMLIYALFRIVYQPEEQDLLPGALNSDRHI